MRVKVTVRHDYIEDKGKIRDAYLHTNAPLALTAYARVRRDDHEENVEQDPKL